MPLLVTAAIVSFYVLALILDRSAGVIYGVLALLGIVAALSAWRGREKSFPQTLRQYWPLSLALAGPLVADIAHQLASGDFYGRSIDQSLRLALFPFVLFTVQKVPLHRLRHLQWAFVAGAVCSAIKMQMLTHGGKIQYGTDFIPIGIFAEMAMLVGIFAAFSIAWKTEEARLVVWLKLLACCAVVYAAYLSGERGVWLSLIALGAIAFGFVRHLGRRQKVFLTVAFMVSAAIAVQFGALVSGRFARAWQEVQMYQQGTEVDTSIGVRFQLWRGSWILFKENPIFGVGAGNYGAALNGLVERKIISPAAAEHPHSHNEILFAMCRFGILGLAALLAVYLVPAAGFLREARSKDRKIRATACMGLSLCLGIMVLGVTDVVFLWWEVYPFYAMSIAVFTAYIAKLKEPMIASA